MTLERLFHPSLSQFFSTLHPPKPRPVLIFFLPCYCSGIESWQQNKQPWQSVSRQPRCCQASVAAFVFERSELHCCVGSSLVHPKSDVRYGCPWCFIIKALIRPRLRRRIWNGWSKSFDVWCWRDRHSISKVLKLFLPTERYVLLFFKYLFSVSFLSFFVSCFSTCWFRMRCIIVYAGSVSKD